MRAPHDDRCESPLPDDSVEPHRFRAAVGLFFIVFPVVLLVGAIRWTIPRLLDADLAAIAV